MKISNLQAGHWFYYVAPIPMLLWLVSVVLDRGYPVGMGPMLPMLLFVVLPSSLILTVSGLIVSLRRIRWGQNAALMVAALFVSGGPLLFLVYRIFCYFCVA